MEISPTCVALVVASMLTLCQGQGQDTTKTPGAFGSSVVDAVVERIRSRCVFSEDRLFLRRVAQVVSRDGEDSATYRPNFNGGIWQVNETMFRATKACSTPDIQSACNYISSSFGIDWPAVTWSDLRKPLYSGLAAALSTLLTLGSRTMPGSITEQADLWVEMYGEQRETFINNADLATTYKCNSKMDLLFLLDSSGSVSSSDFQLMLKFAADVIDAMTISTESVLVAGISFSTSVQIHFDFNDYSTKAQARSKTLNINKVSGGTNTALGLNQAATTLYSSSAGARSDAKKVVVLVTDGQSNDFDATHQSAQSLKDLGTTVFAVGVGGYNLRELRAAASDPICSHVLTLSSFDHIQAIRDGIQKSACEANIKFTKDQNVTGTFPTETTADTRVPRDNKTIEASTSCGILDIYVSTTDPKPGPAVHDDRYRATPDAPATLTITDTLPSGTTLYITVIGTRLPASAAALRNCKNYTWTLGVVPKKDITVYCEEDGVRRPCTNSDVVKAKLCDNMDSVYPVDNPCTTSNLEKGLLRHPYPYDPTKFLQCDLKGNYYITLCPGDVTFNTQTRECGFTSPGGSNDPQANVQDRNSTNSTSYTPVGPINAGNPCTVRALANNEFYQTYSSDATKFIQCDEWGKAWVKACAPSTIWSQSYYTCIKKAKASTRTSGPTVTCSASDNYLPDPCDHHAYYRCVNQQATRVVCYPASLFFNPVTKVCGFVDSNTAAIPASCNASG
ncbi:hypothetical protein V1264_006656 [Littorina saxatilis]|uniref:Uncharacterized protein n=1 Tax=Littorina saxatilis TaxID=31220 RepID=A0AAN9AY44_9CAEN